MKKFLLLLSVLLTLSACETKTSIDPNVRVNPTDLGNNWRVLVKVEDVQNVKEFGQRQWGVGDDAIPPQDVRKVVEDKTRATLEELGFAPVLDDDTAFRSFHVQIVKLDYKLTPAAYFTSEMEASVAFKVTAKNRQENFSQTYSIVKKKRLPLKPSQTQNLSFLEGALGDILGDVFQDEELLHFLSQE